MKIRKSIGWIGGVVLLLGGSLGAFTTSAANTPDSEQVSKLLSEARTMTFQLKDDAQTMESFTGMKVSWATHRDAIEQIKAHVNALAGQVDKLKAARDSASPWQKTVIDRIDPFMAEMNGYTEAVIENLSKHPERLSTPEYKDYLEANADYAGDLAGMVSDFVDYGRTKDKLQRLTDKLEVPAH
jgi:hypothetical protein